MSNCQIDFHILTLVIIMIVSGAFGGFLNWLHNFDTSKNEQKNKFVKSKYILLGIGSSFLVPVFLKMIASDLINNKDKFDNNSYLIFAGFCLIAAIFSRRFINTIGEKILEAAKKAEITAKENEQQIETTKRELTSTQERIEDVKLAVDLKSVEQTSLQKDDKQQELLIDLVDSYIKRTTIEDYTERLKVKAELGRKMGQIIVRNSLSKEDLLRDHPKEGMYLALAYSVQLRPDNESLVILNQLAKLTSQLYIRYVILIGYRTLTSSGFISKSQARDIYNIVLDFRHGADNSLLRHIEDTINMLRFIEPEL